MYVDTLDGEQLELHTGDELLCSGTSSMSKRIKRYNWLMGHKHPSADLTHVAKFICGEVFEATTLNKWANKKGYQCNHFDVWLKNYKGHVWVRQIVGVDIKEQQYCRTAKRLLATPYESGIPGLLELALTNIASNLPGLERWARKHMETKELHCSEANVKLSKSGGYYDPKVRANKMPPSMFWSGGNYEKGFILGRLGPPKQIK